MRFLAIILTLVTVTVGGAGITGCKRGEEAKKVSLIPEKSTVENIPPAVTAEKIQIAVGAMISPKKTFIYYEELLDYIGEHLGQTVELVQRNTYAEVNYLIKEKKVVAAFVCSLPYVEGHRDFGMELLVVPMCYGKTEYYSYIIVHQDSNMNSFKELRGKVFAFSDPMSNSGRLAPAYMLAQMNETPDSFFREYIFTYSHDNSIKSVAKKMVDGAAVDSLIWEYENRVNPEFTSQTKIIQKSQPFGIPPVVVPVKIDPELKQRLKNIFLNIHQDEQGRQILQHLMINKFVEVDDDQYNTIRQIEDFLKTFSQKENK